MVESSKTRAGGDTNFNILEKLAKIWSPFGRRDRFAMILFDELAEWLEFDFEPRTVFIIKVAELDQRMQCLASLRKGPVIDHVEFRLRRAVAIAG